MSERNGALDYAIGEPRVGSMAGFHHFFVRGRASMQNLTQVVAVLVDEVTAAFQGRLSSEVEHPPIILSYGMPDEEGEFDVTAGFSVRPDTPAAGGASVEDVPDYRCASLLLTGPLAGIGPAHEALNRFVQESGLRYGPSFREWYLYWEAGESANNVTMITYQLA